MNEPLKYVFILLGALSLLLVAKPDSPYVAIAFTACACLFGFLSYLDGRKTDDRAELEEQIKTLKNRVDAIYAGKALGR